MTDNREVRRLARSLAALERRLDTMQAPQLHRSSLEDGAIEEFDSEGNLVGIIGRQEDGSHAYVPYTGPVPPIPDTPVVYIKPGFFRAGWNGKFVDPSTYVVDPLLVPPHDFTRVEVHVGETADFTPDILPDSATRVGTIEAPGGGMLTQIVEPGTYYVRLVTRTAPGKHSEPSVAVEVVVEPALDQDSLIADLEALRADLDAAADWIAQTGADLEQRLTQAEGDLDSAEEALAAAKSRLDTAFGVDQSVNVLDLADGLAQDIITAQDTADTAMTTASGKNRVFYSTVAPNAVGTTIGDIWRQRDANGTILGEWRWDGGTTVAGWKPVDYGDGILRSLDVGKITAGTGEVDELVAQVFATAMADIIEANIGNLYVTEGAVIDEAVIDRLWADVVRSRKITTDMLLVGAGENLLVDPTFTDPDLTAHRFAQSTGTWSTGTSSEDSQRHITTPAGNSAVLNLAPSPDADYSPVVPGTAYRIKGRFQGSDRSVRPRVTYRRGDGTTATVELPWSAIGAWANHEWEWVAPSDAAEARFDIELNPGTVQAYIKHLSVTSKTDASLIVDGTIKGRHVDAESVAGEIGEFVKVKAGNLEAGDIDVALRLTAGGEVQVGYEDEEHVLIDPAVGVEYRIPGPETDSESAPITVSRMGRSYAVIDPATGDTLAALTEEGDVTGIGAEFQSLSVGGLDVLEEINARPLGVVASSGYHTTQRGPYTTETGVWELPFLAREGRRYRIEVIGQAQSSVDAVIGYFHYRTGLTADSVPAPTVSDPQLGPLQYWRSAANWHNVYGSFTYEPTQTRYVRVLFSIAPFSGQDVSFRNLIFSVYDEGTQPEARGRHSLGGADGTTPDPTPPPQTFDQEFWFDWSATYNQHGRSSAENYVGSTKMRQGKDAYTTNPYAAALRIPDAARSLMMGASKVEVWVRLTHAGPYSSGTPRFGRHTSSASSPPSTMPSVYSGWTASSSLAKGGTKWYKMPSDWAAAFISGTYYGITLGTTSGAFNFMDFYKHNYSDTSKRPRLRVRVTK